MSAGTQVQDESSTCFVVFKEKTNSKIPLEYLQNDFFVVVGSETGI